MQYPRRHRLLPYLQSSFRPLPECASRNSKQLRSKPKSPPRRTHRPTLALSPSPSESLRSASMAEASSISRRIHCSTALSPLSSLDFCETSWLLLARLRLERRWSRSITALATIAATSTEFQGRGSTHMARASRSTSPRSRSWIGGTLRLGMRQVTKRLCSCKRCDARAVDGSRRYWDRVTQITPTISTSTSYATVRPTTIGSENSRLPLRPCRTKMAGDASARRTWFMCRQVRDPECPVLVDSSRPVRS